MGMPRQRMKNSFDVRIRRRAKSLCGLSGRTERFPISAGADASDHELNCLLYDLYRLTGEEIVIVEGKSEVPS